jgi:Ca-activated chloride channel family protein
MFEFAWPAIFLLAPLPWVLRLVLAPAKSRESALKVHFLPELEQLAGDRTRSRLPSWRRQAPYVFIWFLLLTGAARPQWVGEPLPLATSGRDLLLAVDVSGSMDYPDMVWNNEDVSRLALVKHLIGDFIEGRTGDRVGLILFGSQAYIQAPLTFDRRTVHTLLDEALIGIAGKNTALGDAIGLAVKHLRMRPENSRVMILITDGANNGGRVDPLIAARLAAEERVRIYTIGIGADPQQTSLSSMFGFSSLDLDEDTLTAIARETGGRYFRARSQEELTSISNELDTFEPITQQSARVRPAKALFYWPISLALLLSLTIAALKCWPKPWRRVPLIRAYLQARGRRQA